MIEKPASDFYEDPDGEPVDGTLRVKGVYRQCRECHAPLPLTPFPDDWTMSASRHSRATFITPHLPNCLGEF